MGLSDASVALTAGHDGLPLLPVPSKVFLQYHAWPFNENDHQDGSEQGQHALREEGIEQHTGLIVQRRQAIVDLHEDNRRVNQVGWIAETSENGPQWPREHSIEDTMRTRRAHEDEPADDHRPALMRDGLIDDGDESWTSMSVKRKEDTQ